jgi:tRNA1(Val) A37 N6-methylase TrmN6
MPARARVLEMGCAHGAIILIIAKRRAFFWRGGGTGLKNLPPIRGMDINPDLIELARSNAGLNGLSGSTDFFVADLREHRSFSPSEAYDAVIMNPPYDEPGRSRPSASEAESIAMHGDCCTLEDVVSAAKYLLRNGGRLFLVIRAKRAGELSALLHWRNVKLKRIRAVYPKPDRAASVVLVEAARASGDGVIVEPPLFIYGEDGEYTKQLLAAYRLEEPRCRS